MNFQQLFFKNKIKKLQMECFECTCTEFFFQCHCSSFVTLGYLIMPILTRGDLVFDSLINPSSIAKFMVHWHVQKAKDDNDSVKH